MCCGSYLKPEADRSSVVSDGLGTERGARREQAKWRLTDKVTSGMLLWEIPPAGHMCAEQGWEKQVHLCERKSFYHIIVILQITKNCVSTCKARKIR